MRSGIGISSVHGGKVAYMQEEAKEQQRGRDRSRDNHRVGHRNSFFPKPLVGVSVGE